LREQAPCQNAPGAKINLGSAGLGGGAWLVFACDGGDMAIIPIL
jgi:hypothetical protein